MKTAKKAKGSLDYPVSTGYRANWGDWEAVREIAQNAIDSRTKVTMSWNESKRTLVIKDRGEGFGLRQLLIGESTKDGVSTIGKFGEGMKFAFLALLRSDRTVRVQTNGLVLTPRLKDTFGVDTLTIDYHEVSTHVVGTRVEITGLDDSYRSRFLSLRFDDNMKERVLTDQPGQLYVKGIWVREIPAVAGYNLIMERENPVTGEVDMLKVKDHIASMMMGTKDRDFIQALLHQVERLEDAGEDDDMVEALEMECGKYASWTMDHPNVWRDEVYSHFGTKKLCRATDMDAARNADYKGYTVLTSNVPLLEGVVKKDVQVVRSHKSEGNARVAVKGLSVKERANLRFARRVVEGATGQLLGHEPRDSWEIGDLRVVDYLKDSLLGEGKFRHWVKLARKSLATKASALETMMHEVVHYAWGHRDLTHEFQEQFGKLATACALYMAEGLHKKPKKSAKSKAQRDAEKAERQAALRAEWQDIRERHAAGEGGHVIDHLYTLKMNELAQVAAAFGVNPVKKRQDALIIEVRDAIDADYDD